MLVPLRVEILEMVLEITYKDSMKHNLYFFLKPYDPFCTSTFTSQNLITFLDAHTREKQ